MSNQSNNNTNILDPQAVLRQQNNNAAPINTNLNANQPVNQTVNQNAAVTMHSTLWERDAAAAQHTLNAGDEAVEIVKEFNENQSVGLKSRNRRRMVLNTKRKNQAEANEKLNQQNTAAQNAARQKQGNPQPPVNQAVTVDDIKTLFTGKYDFMGYTDDTAFLGIYDDAIAVLKVLDSLNTKVSNMSDRDYDTLKGQYGKGCPSLEDIKARGEFYAACKKHYENKLKLISNPFYTVLQHRDTASMTTDDLKNKRDKCRADHRDKLADYLDTTITLRELAEKGASRETDSINLVTGYRKNMAGGTYKHHKGYFEAGTVDWEKRYTDSKVKSSGAGGTVTTDLQNIRDIQGEASKPLEGINIGAEVDTAVKARAAKVSYKYKSKHLDFGYNTSLGRAEVSGGIGASLGYNEKESLHGVIRGGVSSAGQLLKGRIKAGVHFLDGNLALGVKSSVKAGEVWADAAAKLGKFKMDEADGNQVYGFYGKGSFGASLASGVVNSSIKLWKFKLTFGITGQVGAVGGEGSVYLTSGGCGASLGVLAGLGAKISAGIDYSEFTDWALEKGIKGAKKAKKAIKSWF